MADEDLFGISVPMEDEDDVQEQSAATDAAAVVPDAAVEIIADDSVEDALNYENRVNQDLALLRRWKEQSSKPVINENLPVAEPLAGIVITKQQADEIVAAQKQQAAAAASAPRTNYNVANSIKTRTKFSRGTNLIAKEYQQSSVFMGMSDQSSRATSAQADALAGTQDALTGMPLSQVTHLHPIPPQGTLYAAKRQQGNPVMRFLSKEIKVEYRAEIVPDFIFFRDACGLFISVKFFINNPDYLKRRIAELKDLFKLRVVLCQVDTDDNETPVQTINQLCLLGNCTLMLCFSQAETARYLETYRLYENKSAKAIRLKLASDEEFLPRMQDALTAVRSVNKTDVQTLAANFGSLKNMIQSSSDQLNVLPGFGPKKVKRLHDAFNAKWS